MSFTSDAAYMGDSSGPPATPAAIVNDLSQRYASVEKLRGIAEQSNANVIFGHDAGSSGRSAVRRTATTPERRRP
jgi:N-acyl homoserine lactone hydrolase